MTVTIDQDAPVIARASIDIEAPAEVVWSTITDIEAWPVWNPDVKSAELHGTLAVGTDFTWRAGPGTIQSTLIDVTPPQQIAWTGKTFGINAVHVWQVQARDDAVELSTEESWQGALPWVLRSPMRKALDRAIRSDLVAVKNRAEARATIPDDGS